MQLKYPWWVQLYCCEGLDYTQLSCGVNGWSFWLLPEENSPFGGDGVYNKLISNSVFAGVISALLILQPSPLFAVEIQLQLHAGLDFTDCGERAVFYDSHAG